MINAYNQESARIWLVFAVFVILVAAFVSVATLSQNSQYVAFFLILVTIIVIGLVAFIYVSDLRFKYIVDSFMDYFKIISQKTENDSSKKEKKTEEMVESTKRK
jgi:hypothetical protein